MIAEANKYNRQGDRCRYVLNDRSNLAVFPDNSFDFIYSSIVLQHMRPEYSKAYMREMVRVLSPGGVVVFQLPAKLRTNVSPRTAASGPLPAAAFRAELSSSHGSLTLRPRQNFAVPLTIRNMSSAVWPALGASDAHYQLFVGNHWLTYDGQMLLRDDVRLVLPHDIAPASVLETNLFCRAPANPGSYLLEVDLVQEAVAWFADRGSPTLKITVDVSDAVPVGEGPAPRSQLSKRYPRLYRVAKSCHLLPAWRWLKGKWYKYKGPTQGPSAPVMEMYSVPRGEVCDVISQSGGKVLRVQDDGSAGPEWLSYKYWVSKP
jgi:SAM-dependent methyltransferase